MGPRDQMAKHLRDEMQAKLPKPIVPRAAPPARQAPEAMNRPSRRRAITLAAMQAARIKQQMEICKCFL